LGWFKAFCVTTCWLPKPNQFNSSNIPIMSPASTLNQMAISAQSQNFIRNNQRIHILRSGGS